MPHPTRAALAYFAVVAAYCASAAWTVHAQTAVVPAMLSQGAVRFVCGGIGTDESTAMRAAMKQHPLSLLFAQPNGDYLADVDVAIRHADGATVLSMRAAGPVCLVDLPAGKYSVEASSGGARKSQAVSVGGAPATLDFRF